MSPADFERNLARLAELAAALRRRLDERERGLRRLGTVIDELCELGADRVHVQESRPAESGGNPTLDIRATQVEASSK